ncbi:MAG: hypothetical protein AB8I08_00585 [Sandaracinaceae bacterium]
MTEVAREGKFGASDDPFSAAACSECGAVVGVGSYYCAVCFAAEDPATAIRQRLAEQSANRNALVAAAIVFVTHAVAAMMLLAVRESGVPAYVAAVIIPLVVLFGGASRHRVGLLVAAIAALVLSCVAFAVYASISPVVVFGPRCSAGILNIGSLIAVARLVKMGASVRRMHQAPVAGG